MFVQILFN